VKFNPLYLSAIVFLLYLAFAYWRVFGAISTFFLVASTALAATLVVAVQELVFPSPDWLMQTPYADRMAITAAGILCLMFLPRLALGLRAQLVSARPKLRLDKGVLPLPSQWQTIQQLIENCGGASSSETDSLERTPYEGKIVSVNAGWGTGKTFVVRNFERLSNLPHVDPGYWVPAPPVNLVVSYFNAWSNQMDPDPEYAIVKHLIADRRVMWPYGWLAVPAWRIIFKSIFASVGSLGGLTVKLSSVSVAGNAAPKPPSLNWTKTLENLAWVTWKRGPNFRRGASLVLIVDDVDRCASLVAQRYITFLRRGLSLPHLAVVLPYTADQLRYKVFDPTSVDLPDLGSSMEAAQAQMIIGDGGAQNPFLSGAIGGREDLLSGMSEDFDALIAKRREGSLTGVGKASGGEGSSNGNERGIDDSWIEALNTWELLRRERLNQSYVEMVLGGTTAQNGGSGQPLQPSIHEQLMRQFESRYVSEAAVTLPRLTYIDMVQIVIGLPSVKKALFGTDPHPTEQLLRYIVEQGDIGLFGQAQRKVATKRPADLDDASLGRIKGLLTFDAMKERSNRKTIGADEWLDARNAPSIRTLIAAAEDLLKDGEHARTIRRYEELSAADSSSQISELSVTLRALDDIFFYAHKYLVE